MGRLRIIDILLAVAGAALMHGVFNFDWFEASAGGGETAFSSMPVTAVVMLAVGLLGLLAAVATVARRTPTLSLALDTAVIVLSLPGLILCLIHDLQAPDVAGQSGALAPGGWLGTGLVAAAGLLALLALRSESRGLKPDPSPPVISMGRPSPSNDGQ
jgi:hypothetical protein